MDLRGGVPDGVEERKKDDTIAKVRFLRDVAGVEYTKGAVELTGNGWSETFICKGQEEAQQMMAAGGAVHTPRDGQAASADVHSAG